MVDNISLECFNDSEKYMLIFYNLFNDFVIYFDPPYECNIIISFYYYLYLLYLLFTFLRYLSNYPYALTQCIVTDLFS